MKNSLPIQELDEFASTVEGKHSAQLLVREMSDGSILRMPVSVISNGRAGPKTVFVAGQHGNEWNGIWILHELAEMIQAEDLHGTLIILPMANPLAFNEGRRVSSIDNIDINRVYLGGWPRKPTEHLAFLLWESIFSKANYLVDLHSAGPGEYLPFAAAPNRRYLDMARSLNLDFIHVPNLTKAGFLVDYCVQAGIASILIEVGGGRSLQRRYHDQVKDGLINLLKSVEMIPEDPDPLNEPYIFENKTIVPAPAAGFFKSAVALGDYVEEGDTLGLITAVLRETGTTVRSPSSGRVLYLRRVPVVGEMESLVHLI